MLQSKYIFGPVASRRLGISLGVDLVRAKTCTLDCVYCEVGRTTALTTERKEYISTNAILDELADYLQAAPKLDYITFSGSGEPTLHSGLGEITRFIKKNYPQYKLALITNSTLFSSPQLRAEARPVDLLLPSLDAASDEVFRRINRPDNKIRVEAIIDGLTVFRNEFAGKMWLEIFIIPGLNDASDEIEKLKQAVHKIKPDIVQLNSLDRPGTEVWVNTARREHLEEIGVRLDWPWEIIARFTQKQQIDASRIDVENAILQTVQRRPCTLADLSSTLALKPFEIKTVIDKLKTNGQVTAIKMERGEFYKLNDEEKDK